MAAVAAEAARLGATALDVEVDAPIGDADGALERHGLALADADDGDERVDVRRRPL